MLAYVYISFFFFFNDTATTEIYTLSLHDALPISSPRRRRRRTSRSPGASPWSTPTTRRSGTSRSEEHTSELQSLAYLVCRLLLEKKKKTTTRDVHNKANKRIINVRHERCLTRLAV